MDIKYIRIAMEKDAGFASSAFNIARRSGIGRKAVSMLGGLRRLGRKPFSTTAKKLFMTRAKPGEIGKNVRSELSFGAKAGGGILTTGVLATPMFVPRKI